LLVKIVTIGTLFMLPLGALVVAGVRRDYREESRLRPRTVAAVWGLYILHLALTLASVWLHALPLPTPAWLRWGLGLPLLAVGVGLSLSGTLAFHSFGLMSGRATDRLVVSGVYRISRNPQNVGWWLAMVGMSWLGATALGLIQAAVFWALFAGYITIEEAFLSRTYGVRYRSYMKLAPRFLGWPGGAVQMMESGDG
jgi:protein-S-isoprenylcysteine O-methyltransferase Ste14